MDISCIVLAGGKGERLGRNKILHNVGGQTLLERVTWCLSTFDSDIILVVAADQLPPQLTGYPKLRAAVDVYPGKGPLVGIYTGLMASNTFYNIAVAGDMPFLNQALLRYLAEVSAGFDIVVPRFGDMVEPLHAIYSKGCLAAIEYLLERGILRIDQLLGLLKVRYVGVEEIDWFDPGHLSFLNVNTEADLKKAREIEEVDKGHDKR